VAVLATGDELVAPGNDPGPDQIVASNAYGIGALARADGAEVLDLGIVPDDHKAIGLAVRKAREAGADVIVTLGGASVGAHDLVRDVLAGEGMTLDFWKVAMRPGKPLMFGRLGNARVLGLPGNPVSSLVCAHLFLRPLVSRLGGREYSPDIREARLATALGKNDQRRDYVRATVEPAEGGLLARPFPAQDSSMLTTLAQANALIVREPDAPAAEAGEACRVLMLR
jgi:molybdopterin molybdotransferase